MAHRSLLESLLPHVVNVGDHAPNWMTLQKKVMGAIDNESIGKGGETSPSEKFYVVIV